MNDEEWINWALNDGLWNRIKDREIWDGKFTKEVTKNYKISIVTTCMGRLKDLMQTLPKNIEDNSDYDNIEFVIVDYNSPENEGGWIKHTYSDMIESGKMIYCRTDEPKYYSMAHSRNIGFKIATGEIINSVDADNYTNKGFATYINQLANEQPRKAIFAKGKKMLRGRLGFYKDEFINELGGYSEDLVSYGHEDHDIVYRAWVLGYCMMWYGGKYFSKTSSRKHQTINYLEKDWKHTEKRNKIISYYNIISGRLKANNKLHWGKAKLVVNFDKEVEI